MSITTAKSGVTAAQTAMGVSVENIINSQSIGSKAAMVEFSSLVLSNGREPYSPGSVTTSVLRNVSQQGILRSTGIATDIAMTEINEFVVAKNSLTQGQGQFGLKRGGSFQLNPQGFLEDNGMFLMGWPVDTNGNVLSTVNQQDLNNLIPVQVNQVTGTVRATGQVEFSGNLASGSSSSPAQTFTTSQTIYDSLGSPHSLNFTFTPATAPSNDPNNAIQYNVTIMVDGNANGASVSRDNNGAAGTDLSTTPMAITFNQNGQLNFFDFGQSTQSASSPPELYVNFGTTAKSAAAVINLNLGQGKGGTNTGIANPTALGTLTAYDANSLITYTKQDGVGYGRFQDINILGDGTVNALFSDGQIIPVAKLALGMVASPNSLQFASGNVFFETDNSGPIILSQMGQNGFGNIQSEALENSTVSLEEEFGRIMELKIYYQGSLMSMKQTDKMSEELIQVLK